MKWLSFILVTACVMHVKINHKIQVDIVADQYTYQKDVLPIIQNRCSMCHNSSIPERNWLDYNTAYKKRANIKMRLENNSMPIGIKMLDSERKLMIDWIIQGAKK